MMSTPPPSLMQSVLDEPLPNFAGLPERFTCVVCHSVLKDPWQTECGHRMCVSCMTMLFETTAEVRCPANEEDCERISRDRVGKNGCRRNFTVWVNKHVHCVW